MQVLPSLHPNKFTVRLQSRQTARALAEAGTKQYDPADAANKLAAAEARRARRNAKRAREANRAAINLVAGVVVNLDDPCIGSVLEDPDRHAAKVGA